MKMSQVRTRGVTLVELLVIISVILIVTALLLPAVQAAREAARRANCSSNLRQLSSAVISYHDIHGSFPLGEMLLYDSRYMNSSSKCSPWIEDKSYLISILPLIEQNNLYNHYNMDVTVYGYENRTTIGSTISVFSCPSDVMSGVRRSGHPLARLIPLTVTDSTTVEEVASTSYAGCHSSGIILAFPEPPLNCRVSPARARAANGCITDVGPISIASVIDGTSHTLLIAEKATSTLLPFQSLVEALGANYFEESGWWFSGAMGDSLFTSFYPPNAYLRTSPMTHHAWTWSASSLHPGGINVAMGDGSVRFVKESIESLIPNAKQGIVGGVWQKLATRNGGEVMSDTDY